MLVSIRAIDALAVAILLIQTLLVGWISCLHSPNIDEPAHLASGIAHWQLGRFEFYRVNPPLIRALAALPVVLAGPKVDYSGWHDSPYARSEFSIGYNFLAANGDQGLWFFILARWACLPVLFAGGWIVYLWAKQLYSPMCGLIAVTLYAFSPNMLAYGASITPDMGGAALGVIAGYTFWNWLRSPNWSKTILAGIALGLAELTKTTWIVLFALWPFLWIVWRYTERTNPTTPRVQLFRLTAMLSIALYLINLGYGFDNSFMKLSDYTFISKALSGRNHTEKTPDNRFHATLLGNLPVPVPEQYVRGIDVQKFDFEVGKWSYAHGEQKFGGWCWYYLYALGVKEPTGNLILLGLAIALSVCRTTQKGPWRHEMVLLAPAIIVFLLISSQTGFSRYVRYVLPCMPFLYIWISKTGLALHSASLIRKVCVLSCLGWSMASSLWIVPHSLSYFNELAGGPRGGPSHLLDANVDWAQDLLFLKKWTEQNQEAIPLGIAFFGEGFCSLELAGLETRAVPQSTVEGVESELSIEIGPRPGWYAVSVNYVYGYLLLNEDKPIYAYFREFQPVATVGYSIYIYHIDIEEANRVRLRLGLPKI